MTGVILTAKHHDGFCLWPSRLSTHTVAQSTWRQGQGDVLRELSDACRAEGLKFGVYLSPWDRHHPAYGTPAYNDVFVGMLEEVLTQYGPIFEVWFDGANGEGPNGKRQVYDWPRFHATVRRLQPNAVMFSDGGPDVRWVGNEAGFVGETNWAKLKRDEILPGTERHKELTEGHADGTHYVPAECDVSIRPGWFWRASETPRVKTVAELEAIWYQSIGHGGSLLLNVPPNQAGQIDDRDIRSLLGLHRRITASFAHDLALTARVSADTTLADGWGANRATDGDDGTAWAAGEARAKGTVTLTWDTEQTLGMVQLGEAVDRGQRVREFRVEAQTGDEWRTVAAGTTVGVRRIVKFASTSVRALRVMLLTSGCPPTLRQFSAYALPMDPDQPTTK